MNDEPIKKRTETFSEQREQIENLDESIVNAEKDNYTYRHLDRKRGVESDKDNKVSGIPSNSIQDETKRESEELHNKYKSVRTNKLEVLLASVCGGIILAVVIVLIIFVFVGLN